MPDAKEGEGKLVKFARRASTEIQDAATLVFIDDLELANNANGDLANIHDTHSKAFNKIEKNQSIVNSSMKANTVSIPSLILHSNIEALTTFVLATILVTASLQFMSYLISKEYDGDFCTAVTIMFYGEFFLMAHNKFERSYVIRHVFLQDPLHFLLYWGICLVFCPSPDADGGVRPGQMSMPLMLLTWFPAMSSTYLLNKKNKTFRKHVKSALLLSLVMGACLWTLTYGYMLPTDLALNRSALSTAIVTGILMPLAIFVSKKLLVYVLWFRMKKSLNSNVVQHFSRSLYSVSLIVTVIPMTLIYFNFDLKYMGLVLFLSKSFEVSGRVFTMIMIPRVGKLIRSLKGFMAKLSPSTKIAPIDEEEAPVKSDTNENESDDEDEDDDDSISLKATRIMVAVRWQQEFTSQKVALLIGPAMLYNLSPTQQMWDHLIDKIPLCFGIEFVTNIAVVCVAVKFFKLPLLTNVPRLQIMSVDFLLVSAYASLLITTVALGFSLAEREMYLIDSIVNDTDA